MPVKRSIDKLPSRRALLAFMAGSRLASAEQRPTVTGPELLPSELKRYADPATEFIVTRLTDPKHSSYLTAPYNRAISRSGFLLYSSDSSGSLGLYRMDLRRGQYQRIASPTALEPGSVALLPNDRTCCYADGQSLRLLAMANLRDRELYSAQSPFNQIAACAVDRNGAYIYVVERGAGRSRIQAVAAARGTASTLVESDSEIGMPLPRPSGGIAYRCGNEIHFCDATGNHRPLPLASGRTGPVYWTPDGSSLLYLNFPERPGELNNIREFVFDTSADKLLAKTTQYVCFAPNVDATVFVGASGSKASPHVLILIRSVRRELTLCEHKARDPRNLSVAFSPNSQVVLFQTDVHGSPAIYSMPVERFVTETES